MNVAVAHFCDVIVDVAPLTFENIEIAPYFPVYFTPGDSISFSHKSYKLLEIPRSINNVSGFALSITINVGLCFPAMENCPLIHREKLVAVSALVEIVSLFLQEQLQLFHK